LKNMQTPQKQHGILEGLMENGYKGNCCCTQILYFCQSSHEHRRRSDRDIIWPNRGNLSRASNISTLKDLSIDKRIVVLWSRQDKTTKQH
jgi:hypothetical protein